LMTQNLFCILQKKFSCCRHLMILKSLRNA